MDNIFEQLLRLYKASLADLIIGYPLNESPINEMWELIIILDFVITYPFYYVTQLFSKIFQ